MPDIEEVEMDIDEVPDDEREPYDPCPRCGENEDYYQKISQWEGIQTNGDGDLNSIGGADGIELLVVRCRSCDQLLYEDQ